MQANKIDCAYWAFLDRWSFFDAAFLLEGIDPTSLYHGFKESVEAYLKQEGKIDYINGPIGFTHGNTRIIERCYAVLNNIDFIALYVESPYYNADDIAGHACHPYIILHEAWINGLPIPEELIEVIQRRIYNDTEKVILLGDKKFTRFLMKKIPEQKIKMVTRNDYTMGLLSLLLARSSSSYCFGDNVSATQIKNAVLKLAKELELDKIHGLKCIERDISSSLNELKNDSKKDLKEIIKGE